MARSSYRGSGTYTNCPCEETISDLIDLRLDEPEEVVEGKPWWAIDGERAAVISLIIHLLIILFLLIMPPSKPREVPLDQQPDPLGLIKMLSPPPETGPIPVRFFPSPGAASKSPGKNPLPSDLNRVAAGGDPKLPKAAVPKSVAKPGIQELAEGKSGEKQPAAPLKGEGGKEDSSGEKSEKTSEQLSQPKAYQPAGGKLKGLVGLPDSKIAGLTAEQAARAAQSMGQSGDDGGGWDRDGGFVDSGPLSFDTVGYDWGAYAAEMIRKIKRNWEVPSLAHYGVKGKLTIRFYILKDGRVEGATILSMSGTPPYDNASLQAILRSSPFRPLPADLGKNREGVTVTFLYNIRPEDYTGR